MGDRPAVGFNLLFLHPGLAGVRVYATSVLRELLRRDRRFDVVLFVSPAALPLVAEILDGDPPAPRAGVTVCTLPLDPTRKRSLFLAENLHLPAALRGAGVDLLVSLDYHGPLRPTVPQVVTLHDLIARDLPEAMSPGQRWLRRAMIPLMVARAREVWTISAFSAARLQALHPAACGKVRVIGSGGPPVVDRAGTPRRGDHLLAVGTFSRHKNHLALVEAHLLAAPGVPLVIVGRPGPALHDPELRRLLDQAGERVRIRHDVADAELRALYRGAIAYLTASRYEGFGITVMEAMSQGVPVACATSGALPEVVGDAALTFDPEDPPAIAAAISRLTTDHELCVTLVERGIARARAQSWGHVAERMLDAIAALLDGRGRHPADMG